MLRLLVVLHSMTYFCLVDNHRICLTWLWSQFRCCSQWVSVSSGWYWVTADLPVAFKSQLLRTTLFSKREWLPWEVVPEMEVCGGMLRIGSCLVQLSLREGYHKTYWCLNSQVAMTLLCALSRLWNTSELQFIFHIKYIEGMENSLTCLFNRY